MVLVWMKPFILELYGAKTKKKMVPFDDLATPHNGTLCLFKDIPDSSAKSEEDVASIINKFRGF